MSVDKQDRSASGRRKYTPELRTRAISMYRECRPDYPNDSAAMQRVAELLGISGGEQVRQWVRRAETDDGARGGVTSSELAEVKRLKRENAELRRANAILKAASAFFAAELDRPGTL